MNVRHGNRGQPLVAGIPELIKLPLQNLCVAGPLSFDRDSPLFTVSL